MQLTHMQVRMKLEEEVHRAGSQQALADKLGISRPYMSRMLSGQRLICQAVLKHLKLRRVRPVVMYEPIDRRAA